MGLLREHARRALLVLAVSGAIAEHFARHEYSAAVDAEISAERSSTVNNFVDPSSGKYLGFPAQEGGELIASNASSRKLLACPSGYTTCGSSSCMPIGATCCPNGNYCNSGA